MSDWFYSLTPREAVAIIVAAALAVWQLVLFLAFIAMARRSGGQVGVLPGIIATVIFIIVYMHHPVVR